MPDKYLIEFLAEWIRDEGLRKKVLHKEEDAMADFGLTAQQSFDLRSLKKANILLRLEQELENDLGINLAKVLQDIQDTGGFGSGAALAYEQDKTHVRGVEPKKIAKGIESIVIVRGHGWDTKVKILFEPPSGGAPTEGKVLEMSCDVDVWQRATVRVTLPSAGMWRVVARVASNTPNVDSTEPVKLEVV